jgi:hypothetical protein
MALKYTGETDTDLNGTLFKATGDNGEHIIVYGSHEALKDYGEDRVKQKACDKYNHNEIHSGKIWNARNRLRSGRFVGLV